MIEHHIQTYPHICNVVLAGNIVAKPVIRYKANPVLPIAEFVIATHQSWFDKISNQFKDWTTYHPVTMAGDSINSGLIHANKGELIYINGRLRTKAKTGKHVVEIDNYQLFKHGSNQGFNTIHCTGEIVSDIHTITTENNKMLTHFQLDIKQRYYACSIEKWLERPISRTVHLWGKMGENLTQRAKLGSQVLIEGSISYVNDEKKNQIIEAKKIIT